MKFFKKPVKFLQEESGVVAIEAAILLPILFMVVFFTSQISIVFYNQYQMNIAANQAARQGTIYSSSRPTNATIASLASAYLTGRLITFSPTPGTINVTAYSCPYTLGSNTFPDPTIGGSGCSSSTACPASSYSSGNPTVIMVYVTYAFTGLFKNATQINPVNLTGTYTANASQICE